MFSLRTVRFLAVAWVLAGPGPHLAAAAAQSSEGGIQSARLPDSIPSLDLPGPATFPAPPMAPRAVTLAASALDRCSAVPRDVGPKGAVQEVLAHPSDPAQVARLAVLHDSLEAAAVNRPDDAETLYLSAVVLGARAEVTSGREKLRWAEAMYSRSLAVLELEPEHAGTLHLVGRIHAAVRRMSGLKRVLAKALFGGDVLGSASWESARANLEAAETGDPCIVDHHYELARLYADLGEDQLAIREIRHVVQLTADSPGEEPAREKARVLLLELDGAAS